MSGNWSLIVALIAVGCGVAAGFSQEFNYDSNKIYLVMPQGACYGDWADKVNNIPVFGWKVLLYKGTNTVLERIPGRVKGISGKEQWEIPVGYDGMTVNCGTSRPSIPVLFILNLKATGIPQTAYINPLRCRKGLDTGDISLELGKDHYVFSNKIIVKAAGKKALRVSLQFLDKMQVLFQEEVGNPSYVLGSDVMLFWAGDIDMDGKLDMLISINFTDVEWRTQLWLSAMASDSLISKVATFRSGGD